MSTPATGLPTTDDKLIESPLVPPDAGFLAKYVWSHPTGFWFFFWGEFAERACYYGMRAILTLYMVNALLMEKQDAASNYQYFIAACYFLPLIGGYIADNFLGKYWTIVLFSVPYIGGQLLMTVPDKTYLVIALGLLAMGSGVIKPNISTLMGMTYDQKRPGQEKLRSDAFAMFYGAINIGAALSSVIMPWLRDHYGYSVAFLFPAALMAVALALFALGKKHYAVEVISRTEPDPAERAEQLAILKRLGGLFLMVVFFWTIFDQAGSTWTLFAQDYLDLNLFGYTLAPDQIQSLNPILIILFLPGVTILWHVLAGWGINLRPTDKMIIGFVLTGLTMAIMAGAGYVATKESKVSVAWEAVAYLLITIAEICISVVGLELAFTAAPKRMKSFVTACWLLTVFVGNIIAAQLTRLYEQRLSPGNYFALNAVMMLAIAVAFFVIARRFNRESAVPHATH